jgi:hypothetical protein
MSRGFASKSMFSNAMVGYETRSMINPVGGAYGSSFGGGGGGGGGEVSITMMELESLRTIQTLYTSRLAAKDYTRIPVDLTKYLRLREIAYNAQLKYRSNPALAVMFQITVDGITGSINAYGLNVKNIETQVQNAYLQGVIEDIISGVNVTKAFDENTGTLSMVRKLELAPLFRYYISLYGVPEVGVGFDPVKLALVLTALQNSGIDPYN